MFLLLCHILIPQSGMFPTHFQHGEILLMFKPSLEITLKLH